MSIGMGVMINMLGADGSTTANALEASKGRTITGIRIKDDAYLLIDFEGKGTLKLWDGGQSCCEHRYMNTDDELEHYIGSEFIGAEVKVGGERELDRWEIVESEFLIITTSKGVFTVVNYNEHNGYYGGFWIKAMLETS